MGRTRRVRTRKKFNLETAKDAMDNAVNIKTLCKVLGLAGWRNEADLKVCRFPKTGRGLCSKKNIAAGSLLISLPLRSLICLSSLELDLAFKKLFCSVVQTPQQLFSFQSLLAFYILFHRHQTESPHHSYINSIPKTFSNPFFCSKDELYFLPECILERIVEQNTIIKASYQYLSSTLDHLNCECCNIAYFPNICTLDQFKWSFFAVNSRCVYIEPQRIIDMSPNSFFVKLIKDEPNLALAPFLDLFNHSDSSSTVTKLSTTEPLCYELYTRQPYSRYQQAFISYGDLPNAKLLVDYGFYLPDNKHDFLKFNLHDIETLVKYLKRSVHRNKFKFIKDHNLDMQMFVHLNDGCSHNLKVILYLVFVEDSTFPNVLNQVAFGSTEHFEDSVRNEIKELIGIKMREYGEFLKRIEGLAQVTESGKVVLGYLNECVLYLGKFLRKFYENC